MFDTTALSVCGLAGVTCSASSATAASCSRGDIRLRGGRSNNSGRVEICYSGTWGTVCDDSWGSVNARVACRQLGFSADGAFAIAIYSGFTNGNQNQRIWLDNVRCTGTENRLVDCPANLIGIHNYNHGEDAGVRCDINECETSSACHMKADCRNTRGSYTCTCHAGYRGNGFLCKDINECEGNNRCHDNADCRNTEGSYFCRCHSGYQGNGFTCRDVNECEGNNRCHDNADCRNTEGNYSCRQSYS